MRAKTLQILWHEREPVFAVDFEPVAGGRLITCGGDKCARVWRVIQQETQPPTMEFLATLSRHTAAVNCVRWSPLGGLVASGGDDGTVLIWQQTETKLDANALEDDDGGQENWRVTAVLRGSSSDIYDLAWSFDGRYILSACIDNSCRIYDTKENKCIHVIADNQHFVQGVAWDPLGKYIATQSSDRCMNIYSIGAGKQGNALSVKVAARHTRIDRARLARRETSGVAGTPARSATASLIILDDDDGDNNATQNAHASIVKTVPSTPSTKEQQRQQSPLSSSRGCKTPLQSRLVGDGNVVTDASTGGPASQPQLSASQPMSATQSPLKASPHTPSNQQQKQSQSDEKNQQAKTTRLFHDENLASFFRRLTFSPDGAMLIAPAGLLSKDTLAGSASSLQTASATTNTLYIYSRGRLTSDPIIHLPGHRTPAVAVRFNPNRFELVEQTLERDIEPIVQLPYRLIFAVATQDAVVVYDTQHTRPIAYFGGMHYATYTDIAWSHDGRMLVMSSIDGFCSMVEFDEGELGSICEHVPAVPEPAPSSSFANAVASQSCPEPMDISEPPTSVVSMSVSPSPPVIDLSSDAPMPLSQHISTPPIAGPVGLNAASPAVASVAGSADGGATATTPAPKKRRIAPMFLSALAPAVTSVATVSATPTKKMNG